MWDSVLPAIGGAAIVVVPFYLVVKLFFPNGKG